MKAEAVVFGRPIDPTQIETSHVWLARFCTRLLRLRPHMHIAHAVAHAVAAHANRHDSPEVAAELFDRALRGAEAAANADADAKAAAKQYQNRPTRKEPAMQ